MRSKFLKILIMIFIFAFTLPNTVHASEPNKKVTMYVGDTKQLKISASKVVWKSLDKRIVSVSKNGKLTAKKAGTTTITATINKTKKVYKVTVKKPSMEQQASKLAKRYQTDIKQVLKYTNKYRKANEVSTLKLDANLTKAACYRSLEMAKADELSHIRPNGESCFTVLEDLKIETIGYRGENVAYVYGDIDAKTVCRLWYESEGHKKNMLDSNFRRMGVGIAISGDKVYYTQIFAY